MASTSIRYLLRQRRTVHECRSRRPHKSQHEMYNRVVLGTKPSCAFSEKKIWINEGARHPGPTPPQNTNVSFEYVGGGSTCARERRQQPAPSMEPSNVTHARQLHMKAPKIGMRTSIRSSNAPASDSILGLEAAVHDGHATGLNPWTRSRRTRRSRCWAQSGTVPVRRQKHFVRR